MNIISDTDQKISRLGLIDLRNDRERHLYKENYIDMRFLNERVLKDEVFESYEDASSTSSEQDDDDINYLDYDDEQEFESIFTRICLNQQEKNSQNLKLTLKYLFKLLKFYKLEHYMMDLIDNNFLSPISLVNLKQNDFNLLNVSPYDRKKFVKLQLFLKQVINTIKMTNNKTSTKTSCNSNNNKVDLNLKMFTINEWKHLANESIHSSSSLSSKSSSLSSSQIKTSNDQLKQEANLNKNHQTPIWTEISQNSLQDKNMKKTTKAPIVVTSLGKSSKPTVSRAKSIEPNSIKRGLSLNPVSSKSTTIIPIETNSVTHPNLNTGTKSASNFFGPKIHTTNKEIANVELVTTKTYNYGVPQNLNNKNKGFIRKTVSISNVKSNENTKAQLNNALTTNEIYVFARKRPKLQSEADFQDVVCVDYNENSGDICVNEIKTAVDGTPILRKNEFDFDKTFDSIRTNEDIYKSSILPFINVPFKNRTDFNCICFGQTGSGKTHTLFGNKQQDGLCVLTAESLFNNNERLFCGFYEIYNGQLYDLINRNNKLVLREDSSGQVNVVGLVEVEIKSIAQLRKTIELSQSNRHIGSTSFNKASSRSHAVIQFKVPNLPSNHINSGQVIMKSNSYSTVKSKVNSGLHQNNQSNGKPFRVLFIDLAGSERGIDAQNNLNDNRKEGAEINQSLLALKECIRCIDQFRAHAPFRQSKLTRVLRDCFIGTGKTVLIATVSPTDDCIACSLNTLQYANRVRQMALRNRKRTEITNKIITNKTENKPVKKTIIENPKPSPRTYQSHMSLQKNEEIKRKTNETQSQILNKNRSKSVANVKKPIVPEPKNMVNQKSLKNFITSKNPVSSVAAAAMVAAVASVNATCVPTNNILQSKTLTKSASSTGIKTNSLFHPSKINCSSTPIKSVIKNEVDYRPAEEMLFVNDTPIKGHKLRLMTKSSSQMLELAERYFDRVQFEGKNAKQANKFTNKTNLVFNNDLLNSKFHSKINIQRVANLFNDKIKNEDYESGVESDELNKSLDKKLNNNNDRINNEERIKQIYSISPSPSEHNDPIDLTLNDEKLIKLRQKQREMIESKKFLNNGQDSTNIDLSEFNENSNFSFHRNDTSEHLKNAIDSQNQLRSYIRNLEDKLTHLRNEIKDQNPEDNLPIRKNSTDSTDSIKESKNFSRDVYCEFLQQRKLLEKQQENLENSKLRRNSKLIDNEDDLEKKFIQSQLENSKSSSSKSKENRARLSSDDTLYSDNNDAFEKSIHKGSSLFNTLETKNEDPKCQFYPIAQEDNKNKIEPVLTPRTLLLNPIPIRLGSSSSSFESSFSVKNILPKNDESENISPRLKASSSKIWRTPSHESDKLKSCSNILIEHNESEKIDRPGKVQIITAHENQLSDLSETCQKEMNLIMNLKESKMDFKDYLSQMEEMLSKKFNSIRDLQNQISQLKTENF
ncbi:unnamed protein product [Brachionus calyciflorus]|uniref:Kinesin motor domain-containing protein n=1 Tax=Brachionus calyciflorus TaxID=104777 RepID=A0A813WW67_9BILA|nr:unnamed protein product [Brachionus calyciflorus]